MVPGNALVGDELREIGMKFKSGFAAPILDHADALQRHRIAETGAHRFRERFLGGEAVGDEQHRIDGPGVTRPFALRQHAAREALAVFFEQARDPVRFNHIDADAIDHERPLSRRHPG